LPYRSPAEREQANWLTLPEAQEYVVRVDKCSPEDAQHQISRALGNGALKLRWEDERPMRRFSAGGLTTPLDQPPRYWTTDQIEEIDWQSGTAIDRSEFSDAEAENEGRKRKILIHRLSLEHLWKLEETPAANESRGAEPKLDFMGKIRNITERFSGTRTAEQRRAEPRGDAPKKERKVRRDEKRPEIARAVADLKDSKEWQEASDKKRCRMVEGQLGKPRDWCSPRTLRRAMGEAGN
jgi:hypothetical protein